MKKANTDIERPAAVVNVTPEQVETLKGLLMFPIDEKARKAQARVEAFKRTLVDYENTITYHKNGLAEYYKIRSTTRGELAKAEKEVPNEYQPKLEVAQAQVDAIAKLAWVKEFKFDGTALFVIAHPGMLKTKLETRIVDFGGGNKRTEFVAEPVVVSLPQYEIFVQLTNMGSKRWANRSELMIRMIDPQDVREFIGGKVTTHNPRAHWAAGSNGFTQWSQICLGEYEKGFAESSLKGVADLLVEIANYLQTAGDEHAYMRKAEWALGMGNPHYNPHIYRLAEKGETTEQVDERYKRDYKVVNAIEFKDGVQVNPGANGEAINIEETGNVEDGFTFRDMLIRPTFEGVLRQNMFAYTVAPEPFGDDNDDDNDTCDCMNAPEFPGGCDCDGGCACHDEHRNVD